ncbi:MAG: hypothetical protein HY282_00135 [Nitrospirae bacterium]|nr:hypothetical protein [Candidatus Manganitrophaceae bacterium]
MSRAKIGYLVSFFLFCLALPAHAGDFAEGGNKLDLPLTNQIPHRTVKGVVDRIDDKGMISVKTDEGTIRSFGVTDAKKEGIQSLKPGDRITLELDEGNLISDIHKGDATAKGDTQGTISPEGKGGSTHADHHSVTGTVELFDPIQRKVTVKTEDGQSQSFEIKMPIVNKLNGVSKGTKVTLEIDEQNRVMDVHQG